MTFISEKKVSSPFKCTYIALSVCAQGYQMVIYPIHSRAGDVTFFESKTAIRHVATLPVLRRAHSSF